MSSDEVSEEIEAVTAILDEDTVEVDHDASGCVTEISIKITPLTASEQEKQYVSLTLVVTITEGYPSSPPGLGIRNPRGLEESAVASLLDEMTSKCEEYSGCPVMFELIEMGREFLTARNVPVVRCIICLNNIQEEDQFMKTECLHFFHKHCLGRYITNMQETYDEQRKEAQKNSVSIKDFEVLCPVCREPIGDSRYNLSDLLQSEPPVSEQAEPVKYSISEDVKKLQKTMEELFIKQKEKGGIIDLEAEEKKFLVVTNSQESRDGADSNTFTELSPTDYQLDEAGIPCAKTSPPKSPAKSANNNDADEDFSYSYQSYHNNHHTGYGKGRGRGGKRGFHRQGPSSESQDERDRRNAYRKNHYLNRGKSHHQLKKDKKGVPGGAAL